MNTELLEALTILEEEKDISRDTLMDAIENSLINACKNHFGKADNIKVIMDKETCDYTLIQEKTVVEEVEDKVEQISLADAKMIDPSYEIGDIVQIPVESKSFGRIATQNAKNLILQKIREEERKVVYDQYFEKEKDIVTGVVQRYIGKNVSVNLGKADAILTENEQVKGEKFEPTERIKLYVVEVKNTTKGPKILVSRTHPELVKRLFEAEVTEVRDGIVEIKSIAREAGSRTKMAVWSNDPNVDPVGACVGMNGARVNAVVQELRGEKIDIINWDENPALLIENSLSPAKVISVMADPEEKIASVIVPDYQLSLAMLLISTVPSLTSATSASKRRFTSSGCVRDTSIFGPFGVFFTSTTYSLIRSVGLKCSPFTCSFSVSIASALPRLILIFFPTYR